METVVYGDVYFLINFSLDFFALYITARLLGLPRKTWRFVISAGAGGIYATIALFLLYNTVINALTCVLACLLCSAIAFAPEGFFSLFKTGIVFFAVSALSGGLFSALSNLLDNSGKSTFVTRYIALCFFLFAGVVTLFVRFISASCGERGATLTVTYGKNSVSIPAFADTGNFLREPISGVGIALITKQSAKRLFGDELCRYMSSPYKAPGGRLPVTRIRIVPRTIGGKTILIPALRPDRAVLQRAKNKTEKDMYIAVLSEHEKPPDGYDCILPNSVYSVL